MKFGTQVLVRRGSSGNPPGTPGCLREVKGILIGANDWDRIVRLTEDDPLATCGYCLKAGEVGRWSPSTVRPFC